MRYDELVAWTLSVADRVKRGQKIEDTLVELKREWIAPTKLARMLAGQANAAGGSDILWIVGLDETDGVVGAPDTELAQRLEPVFAQFAGPQPRLILDATPEVDEKTLRALLFSTDRAPYVVKNPLFGIQLPSDLPVNPVAREVPWREGTTTRSATHEDLIRILSPLSATPEWEVLSGYLNKGGAPDAQGNPYLALHLALYVDCARDIEFSIPFHRCVAELTFPGVGAPLRFKKIQDESRSASSVIESTVSEILVRGPGLINLVAHGPFDLRLVGKADAEFSLTLHSKRVPRPMVISGRLRRSIEDDPRGTFLWKYESLPWAPP